MLPTFVIGLREGLEAVLIVTIIATFLRQNRASLRGLWIGVGAGVVLSIAIGIVLKVVEDGLPQAKQEAMETVIGGVAVFFVTGMVLWMRTHARHLKTELETAAAAALRSGTTTALAVMAFLSVLREGFETSVFLLATFQNASSAPDAMLGALLGILAAVALGWAMFAGGVKVNLQRFFKYTGVFLLLVAAGLVLNAFRTAHEAGWVTVGQGRTLDLSWLTPNGSVRSALITGVLGIPADPRVIEVLGWACYLVPMLALTFWPAALKPSYAAAQRLRVAGAALAVVVGVVLLSAVRLPQPQVPTQAPVASGGTAVLTVSGDSATLTRAGQVATLTDHTETSDEGADTRWTAAKAGGTLPATLTLQQLLDHNGGRIPSGMSVGQAPGPFTAQWTDHTQLTVLTRAGGLVDARQSGDLVLVYSGGGLTTPRVLTVADWQVAPSYVAATTGTIAASDAAAHDRTLWKHWVPAFLGLLALCLLGQALRLRLRRDASGSAVARGVIAAAQTSQPVEPEGSASHVHHQA